jgi:hypothetical protein
MPDLVADHLRLSARLLEGEVVNGEREEVP